MNATRVPITKVSENRSETIISLIAVFLLGATLGSGFILYQNDKLTLPSFNTNAQLGAVALSDSDTQLTTNNESVISTTSAEQVVPTTNTVATEVKAVSVREDTTLQKRELALRINDRTIAIERLNQEIERTKNASVATITAFEQNCGSWNDACAVPYASKLNESNTTYNELVATLSTLSSELDALKESLRIIQ